MDTEVETSRDSDRETDKENDKKRIRILKTDREKEGQQHISSIILLSERNMDRQF